MFTSGECTVVLRRQPFWMLFTPSVFTQESEIILVLYQFLHFLPLRQWKTRTILLILIHYCKNSNPACDAAENSAGL